eukprot:12422260-Ditylum_brightwellii.AAC.1
MSGGILEYVVDSAEGVVAGAVTGVVTGFHYIVFCTFTLTTKVWTIVPNDVGEYDGSIRAMLFESQRYSNIGSLFGLYCASVNE